MLSSNSAVQPDGVLSMTLLSNVRRLASALAALAAVAALSAGCGGGGSLSSGTVASVNGTDISQSELERVISQAKGRLESQGQKIPAAGSEEYQAFQQNALQYLVQRVQFEQKAKELRVTVTSKEIEERLDRLKTQFFGGSDKKYRDALEKQGITDADVRDELRATLLSEGIFKKVQAAATVTPQQIQQYYNANPQLYEQQPTREVRHILVKSKALADEIYAKLKGGASFKELALRYSTDSTKKTGGKLTITRGETVPQFDKVAFELKTGALSKPVKTRYGWHVIEALAPATKLKQTPFAKVRDTIRQTLLSQKQSEVVTKWLDDLKREYSEKIDYAPGFAPPTTAEATPTDTSTR